MGYTHYWNHGEIDAETFASLVTDARHLAKSSGVRLANGNGTGEPQFRDDMICLNGAGDESYETFVLTPRATGFDFCKTEVRPYDEVVTAILLRAATTIPGFHVRSDGSWTEWDEGRTLYAKVFGDEPVPPSSLLR